MIIIPAIDLKDGCVVRFVQGYLDKQVYSKDPLKTAKHWVRQGAELVHLVDLDGAFTGVPKNLEIVKEIARGIAVPVQFGGGIRTIRMIKELLDCGIKRIVLGTMAIQDEDFLKKAFGKFKDRIIVSVDIKQGRMQVGGWQAADTAIEAGEFIRDLKKIGFSEIIYTDVSKDGTLEGPNLKDLKHLLKQAKIKIIASGGISSLADIARLKLMEKNGLVGIIIGKALYERRFTLREALRLAEIR